MIIKGSEMSLAPLVRAIWNELFKIYMNSGGNLNDLTELLIDYDTIYSIVVSRCKEPFYWACSAYSSETLLEDVPYQGMVNVMVAFLENGDVEISEIDLTVAEGNVE